MTPPVATPPLQGAYSNLRVAVVASVSATIVTLILVSAIAPFSLGARVEGHAGGATASLRHVAKEGADESEIPAISKLLGRKFRTGSGPKCDPEARKYNHNFMRELPHRNEIGTLLQTMNLTGDGVERKYRVRGYLCWRHASALLVLVVVV